MDATANRRRLALDRCKANSYNNMSERSQWAVWGLYADKGTVKFSKVFGGGLITTKRGKPETKAFVRRQVFRSPEQ
jgi:hypothetical protein